MEQLFLYLQDSTDPQILWDFTFNQDPFLNVMWQNQSTEVQTEHGPDSRLINLLLQPLRQVSGL